MAGNMGTRGSSRGQRGTSNRGFAAMDDDEQRRIASKGGQASARDQQRDDRGRFAGSAGRGGGSRSGGRSSH